MKETARNRTSLIIFSLVTAAILTNTVLTVFNLRRMQHNASEVEHTNEVLIETKSLQGALVDLETGVRGYVITGQPKFLEPFNTAMITKLADRNSLKRMTVDNVVQQDYVEQLDVEIEKYLAFVKNAVRLRDTEGIDAATAEIASGRGKKIMDSIRRISELIQTEERRLLGLREQEFEFSLKASYGTVILTSLLGLGMVLVGSVMVSRDAARKAHLANELQKNLVLLEERVQQRTAELTQGYALLTAEVAERRKAEEQANLLTDELRRSNRELEQFASVASHDLQEPLRKIQAFGDRLNSKFYDQLSEVGRDYLDRMLASAGRMRSLIDGLLAYSRVTNKTRPFQPVDLSQLAQEVVGDLDARLLQTGGKVVLGDLPTLDADPLLIRQLLQNLLGNALKFRRPEVPPVVQVHSRLQNVNPRGSAPTHCEITIEDNGIGFEQVYVDRIFELFQRLHGRDEYEGTGMGLAICRKIVDRHNGQITAESSPGNGAKFLIKLPLKQANT